MENNTFAAPVCEATKEQIKPTEKKAKYLETVVQTYLVRGLGHYSKTDLEKTRSMCEEIYRVEKDITAKMNALASLGKLA